jgi:hypothetical protein
MGFTEKVTTGENRSHFGGGEAACPPGLKTGVSMPRS